MKSEYVPRWLPSSRTFQFNFLPCFVFSGKYLRQKRIDFQLPYDILWLWKHDQVINLVEDQVVFRVFPCSLGIILTACFKRDGPVKLHISMCFRLLNAFISTIVFGVFQLYKRPDVPLYKKIRSSEYSASVIWSVINLCTCISVLYDCGLVLLVALFAKQDLKMLDVSTAGHT